MKERFDKIRELLDEIEKDGSVRAGPDPDTGFAAMELPLIIQEIVDDLQPLLMPYQMALYWYMFRHSIAKDGNSLVRVSTRALQAGVVKSMRTIYEDGKMAYQTVRESLAALESLGAIKKQGEPNQEGTPYRVLIPDEIEACRKYRAERAPKEPKVQTSEREIDYYNVRENRIKVYDRDGYKCRYCAKQLTLFTATLDHIKSVSDGGDNSFQNLVTACLGCNSQKNARRVGDFLAER